MSNGQVTDLDQRVEEASAVIAKSRRVAHLPAFLRIPIVLSSKTAARMRPGGWMFYDAVVAAGALTIGYTMTPRGTGLTPSLTGLAVFALAAIVGGNISGLYDRQILLTRIKLLLTLFLTSVIAISGVALFTYIILFEIIGRWILLIASGTFFLASLTPRLAGHYAAHLYRIRILLVGDETTTSAVAQRLSGEDEQHVLAGFCGDSETSGQEALGTIEDIPRLCRELRIDEIVIANGYMNRSDVLDKCFQAVREGCRVLDEASFHEEVFEEVPVNEINEGWFYAAKLGGASPFHVGLKRILDVTAATTGIVLTLPLLPVLWVLVRLTSAGPVFYSQVRCGQFGRPFRIYKFRSMYIDAETSGVRWAGDRDPRVTRMGRFLRKTRLDEIPQFWNVLKGDMSFVGPRPERPELVAEIGESVSYFAFRNLVRPGITGLAQVRFKYGSSIEDARKKLQHDLYYIKNWSLMLDLQIILRTISAVMKGSR